MNSNRDGLLNFFQNEASIFVPKAMSTNTNVHSLVSGCFVSKKDVIWRDESGCLDLLVQSAAADSNVRKPLPYRALKTIYPSLQGFFVEECNIQDVPSFNDYYHVLKFLSRAFSPHEILGQVHLMLNDLVLSNYIVET
jgi:hypothetical protein